MVGTVRLTLPLLLALVPACGASQATDTTQPRAARSAVVVAKADQPLPTEPIQVALSATQVGAALRVDIEAVGRGHYEHAPFEDPTGWRISVKREGSELPHLVNGPVKIDRMPAGKSQWDTVVRFSVVYEVGRNQGEVEISVDPPDGPPVEQTFSTQPDE